MSDAMAASGRDLGARAERYDAVYRSLHWTMAALFLVAVCLGLWASQLVPGTSPRREILEVHKSLGMTILVLAVMRLGYRLAVKPPALSHSMSTLVRRGASLNHWLLYAVMLAMPVTGYITSGAGGHPLRWFWLFDLPRWVGRDRTLELQAAGWHEAIAWIVYALLAGHIGATLWHVLVKRDGTLARMTGR